MAYRWKPNASQRRAFSEKMQDPQEKEACENRKASKRGFENFDKEDFVPSKDQRDYAVKNIHKFDLKNQTEESKINYEAFDQVMQAYDFGHKVPHKLIHIVQTFRRDELKIENGY